MKTYEDYSVEILQRKYIEHLQEKGIIKGNLLEKDKKEGNIIYLRRRVA